MCKSAKILRLYYFISRIPLHATFVTEQESRNRPTGKAEDIRPENVPLSQQIRDVVHTVFHIKHENPVTNLGHISSMTSSKA
jgi:hypothetical protein